MTIDIERHGAVALLRLRGGKANAMNLALLDAIDQALGDVDGAPALVITGEGKAFSAGLALPELVDLDHRGITKFIARFEAVMERVLAWRGATVAAINGHAIAGGCVLALACDARVMADGDAKIGLNEVQLGIGLPAVVVELLHAKLPRQVHGRIAFDGALVPPAEALALHLVDEVVPAAQLVDRGIELAAGRARHSAAYAQIKEGLQIPVLAAIELRRDYLRKSWVDGWFSADAQATLREAVARITKR
jgi:Delta3-Delta2-enoyl-CoA isomerase